MTPIVHMDADGWRSVGDLGNQRQRPDEADVVLVAGKLDVDGVRDVDDFAQWATLRADCGTISGAGNETVPEKTA